MTQASSHAHPALQQADLADAYRTVYDLLATMYWETSDLGNKDLLFGAREAVGTILDAINQKQLAGNTAVLNALLPQIRSANKALQEIKDQVNQITRNISTASQVIAAISKVLSLVPAL